MHQIYIQNHENEANKYIADIQKWISQINRNIEGVEGYFTENELLDNYCYLFFGIKGNIKDIKKELEKITEDKAKTLWINKFFENFSVLVRKAGAIAREIGHKGIYSLEITNLFLLENEANWKIVLLALFYNGGDNNNDENLGKKILKLLEILCFKLKLGDFRADRLPRYAKWIFDSKDGYDINRLYKDIKNATENGFRLEWNGNDNFKNIIENYFDNKKWHYNRIIKYVLWQYENHLREKNKSGILLDKSLYDSYTIEHIKPRTPIDEEYTEEFKQNYLHLAGNLALLTQNQNSKFGNKSFDNKRNLFQDTALSSYTEIRENSQWIEAQITERHKRISEFAKNYFDITNL